MADLLDELTIQDVSVDAASRVIEEEYDEFDATGVWFDFKFSGLKSPFEKLRDDVAYILKSMRVVESFEFASTEEDGDAIYCMSVKLRLDDFYQLIIFWTVVMHLIMTRHAEEYRTTMDVTVVDKTVPVYECGFDYDDLKKLYDLKEITSNRAGFDTVYEIFKQVGKFDYKNVAAAKLKIMSAETFRRIKHRGGLLSYTFIVDVIYKKLLNPTLMYIDVDGRSYIEMYMKSWLLTECVAHSTVTENGRTKSKFDHAGIMTQHYVWNPAMAFDVGGPANFFKRCAQCMDARSYDFSAIEMALDNMMQWKYLGEIEYGKSYDPVKAVALMQHIVDELKVDDVLSEAEQISKALKREMT